MKHRIARRVRVRCGVLERGLERSLRLHFRFHVRIQPTKDVGHDMFLAEVVEGADCGILLDVNNIYVSSQNHNFNPLDYVNSIPAERVAQIHIAGHSKYRKYILDTHDHPVIDPVWKLYDRAIQRAGHTATLLEWDDSIPTFKEVHDEALKADKFLASSVLATAV